MNQKVAVRLLKKLGYQVDIANNGQEAVEMAKMKRYSILLVDLEVTYNKMS
jgi:CheY-like chemotaxis protein